MEPSLQEIGSSAFSGCAITSVTIPKCVTLIEKYAFQNCTALREAVFEEPNGWAVTDPYGNPPRSLDAEALLNPASAALLLARSDAHCRWQRSDP